MTASSSQHVMKSFITLEDHVILTSTENNGKLSPAEIFKNKYLTQQQNDNESISEPDASDTNHAPLNSTEIGIILDNDSEEEEHVIFEPKSPLEPKIVLDKENKSSKILTKLSKSTAPMRAKISKSKTNLDHLWSTSSTTLTLPIRKSAESVHHMSISRSKGKKQVKNERSQSFSFDSSSSLNHYRQSMQKKQIYPALLSKVAFAFKENMVVGSKLKDSIQYHDVFDGRDAVNKLAAIINTSDRNLAVLIGRALDHQKFFHDVNYEHRLRDSSKELYQFKEVIQNKRPKRKLSADSENIVLQQLLMEKQADEKEENNAQDVDEEEQTLPNGIFTPLTDCYSPTCTSDNTCYSVLCPRRFIQPSHNSLPEENEDRLWINSVSKTILNSLTPDEIRRQENIFELIYTEKDFVDDLAYVNDSWIQPLLTHDCLPQDKREQFVKDVFWNMPDICKSNSLLLDDLLKRQKNQKMVQQIGDIFLNHVLVMLEPFVDYGSHQVISKYIFETEKSTNPSFAKYVENVERLPISRKLELNGYLTKPTTRLGRYNLLLREILKHTPENHSDRKTIPAVMGIINRFLERVNEESGKTENRFSLEILEKRLSFYKKSQDIEDLDLLSNERKIIMKGPLKRTNSSASSSETAELQIYVLDHCLLIIKSKFFEHVENYKLYKKPIPLALLAISLPDQSRRSSSILPLNRSSTGTFYSTGSTDLLPPPILSHSISTSSNNGKAGYPISFSHLGRQGSGTITLYASTYASRRKWVDTIEQYRNSVMEKLKVFRPVHINDRFFNSFNKINCAAAYKSSIMIGCDHGVYLKKYKEKEKKQTTRDDDDEDEEDITRILSLDKVSQIDILEGPKLMIILADKILYTFSLDSIFDKDDNIVGFISSPPSPISSISSSIRSNHGKSSKKKTNADTTITTTTPIRKLSNNVSFFKIGNVFDKSTNTERTLVCFVKYNAMTSIIRALEPYNENLDKKKRKSHHHPFFIRNTADMLGGYKDLYIPGEATSIQYFKNVICVGSAKGFQMVDIGSAGVQSVLDPNDENHNFIKQRETLRPISMFRHADGCILLCYNEIAFYIDKKGRRVRPEWTIHWEGHPTAFAFSYPYVIAFDNTFIEIRHIETGDLTQVIPGNNIRCLRPDPTDDNIYCVMEDRRGGTELLFNLKLFDKMQA